MADPQKYTVTFDFSGFQATWPSTPLPGQRVDDELANVATSIGEIVDALAQVRRSDGALQNGSVTLDSLAEEVETRFQGASAYQLAVENGFVGTESEWLASLEGDAATIQVGTVTTLEPGQPVTIENVGTSMAAVFNFGIPKGQKGDAGDGTGDMVAADYDPQGIQADVFDVDNHTDGTTNKVFTAIEKSKLTGVAAGATANSSDAALLNRANHTGTQAIATVSGLQTALDGKLTPSDIGSTVQAYDSDTLKGDTDAALTAGFTFTEVNDGTKSTGSYTPTPNGGQAKNVTNGGAHELRAPTVAGAYTILLTYTNNASAGAITFTNFAVVEGSDKLTTTNGHKFHIYITKAGGSATAMVKALQ